MPLFAKKPTPKEAARAAQRDTRRQVRRSEREMERELRDLDRVEKQVTADIKKRARSAGVNPATDPSLKALAKQLVQVRQQKEKLVGAKANLGAMGMKTSIMATQVSAAAAVGSVSGALASANAAIDPKEMNKVMNEFTKQNEVMNMKEELMDDALADAFDGEGVDEEAEEITNQVLAELGVELDQKMTGLNAPMSKPNAANGVAATEEEAQSDLMNRLNAL